MTLIAHATFVLFVIVLCYSSSANGTGVVNASMTLFPEKFDNLTSDQEVRTQAEFNITGNYNNISFELEGSVENWRVFSIVSTNVSISGSKGFGEIVVRGRTIGRTKAFFKLVNYQNKTEQIQLSQTLDITVLKTLSIHTTIFEITTTTFLIVIIFLMGTTLDLREVLSDMKKPLAPAIGLTSQFIMMPLVAFGLSFLLPLEKEFGLGLLTIGCSPGGGVSNMWTVMLGGDLNLSMTMTFFSTIAALGLMPLWIFALSRFYIDVNDVIIPYEIIAFQLLQFVLPAIAGMVLRYFKKSLTVKFAKAIRLIALLFIIFVLTYGFYANLEVYRSVIEYPMTIPAGALLPWLGFFFGGLAAFICRQGKPQIIAISLETGFQNVGVAMLVLLYSMPPPLGDLAGCEPLVVAVTTPFPLLVILTVKAIKKSWMRYKSTYELQSDKKLQMASVNKAFEQEDEKMRKYET